MVAYSFKRQFAEPILAGIKRQTIRAPRRRHARPDEQLQLYTGMRTKQCKLIMRATCREVKSVLIEVDAWRIDLDGWQVRNPEAFARLDGFGSAEEMQAFWRDNHPGLERFEGVLIAWDPIAEAPHA